jgi:hypothetical protein
MARPRAIYAVDPETALARLVQDDPGEGGSEVFIRRRGSLSRTSEDTIAQINQPALAPPLVRAALEILRADARVHRGRFPVEYYARFGRSAISAAIRIHGVDNGIEQAERTFGLEVGASPSRAPFHVFESIARQNDDSGWDKVQHFVRSATACYKRGNLATDSMQYGKEIFYDEVPSWVSSDRGFDPADMLANNRGQAYGQQLFQRYHPVRAQAYSPSLLFRRQVAEPLGRQLSQAEQQIRRLYGVP